MTDMTERVQETVARLRTKSNHPESDYAEAADLLEALAARLEEARRINRDLNTWLDGDTSGLVARVATAEARIIGLEALLQAYQDGTVPDLTAVSLAGGKDRNDEVKELLAKLAEVEAERNNWREDPESNEAWCAGNQFALDRLCRVLKIDPNSIDWDGSDGSLTEEADSLIWRIVQAHAETAEAEVARLRTAAGAAGVLLAQDEKALMDAVDAGLAAVIDADDAAWNYATVARCPPRPRHRRDQMTAPDRIWLWNPDIATENGVSITDPEFEARKALGGALVPRHEYVRSAPAVLAADAMVQAMIAAAYGAASDHVVNEAKRLIDPEAKGASGAMSYMRDLADEIDALTPADATSALARLLAEAENRGIERAADVLLQSLPREYGDHRDYRKAILALKGATT